MADRPNAGIPLRRGGLGRGLESLIPTSNPEPATTTGASTARIADIEPNPYQPRTTLDTARLQELAESIRTHGVIQPLIVRSGAEPGRYVLIAGERRWRAARLAGVEEVPVVVKEAADQEMLELALVENVVRADLSPLEEAHAYRQLIDEFGLTQAKVASRVGRSRVSVTNTLRLLNAPMEIQEALEAGDITEGHARALLGLGSELDQIAVLRQVIEKGLSVRQTEEHVRSYVNRPQRGSEQRLANPQMSALADRLQRALQTKVTVRPSADGTGVVSIHYFTDEQLTSLYQRLVGEDDF